MSAVRDAADRLRGALRTRRRGARDRTGEGKLTFLAAVTDDLVAEKTLRADELVREVAKITGGSGRRQAAPGARGRQGREQASGGARRGAARRLRAALGA